jgi:TatD DNase family protein
MSPGIIDTHTHLCDVSFDADLADVLERAQQAGVSAVIAVSEILADARRNVELAQVHPMIQPAAGLYPTHLDLQEAEALCAFIRRERSNLCAIGEVGLDHWKVKEDGEKEQQREIFRQFIELSRELDLPLNVHSRSAGRHAIALLLECGAPKVQMHAFDGKASTALLGVEAGYFFSIPPSIVRSRQKQKLVKQLPLSCLLVETDSPVLAPNPNERNEPVNVVIAIEAIADIKQVSKEEVVEAIIENTRRLYGDL